MPKRDARPFELLLWGATGFTGRLAAEWLAARYPDARVALGGRSESKLEKLRDELVEIDPKCAAWPIRVGDAFDVPALDAIVPEASVVASTAGPFSLYGHELAAACARHGTDYCDITGEIQFVRALVDRNHARARDSGARLVPFCGFDSIPSDLGVYSLQRHLIEARGEPCESATFVVLRARGGFSGGTVASMIETFEEAGRDARVREMLRDPQALAEPRGLAREEARGVRRIDGAWTAPFVMAMINTRVVYRTNALLGFPWGDAFRYEERVALGSGARGFARAQAMNAGLVMAERALAVGAVRGLAKRFLPESGEGPSQDERKSGSFRVRITGADARGESLAVCNISGEGDPGYTNAAKMLIESAFCLARDLPEGEGGVLTPASAMGEPLARRLRAAGIPFDVTDARA